MKSKALRVSEKYIEIHFTSFSLSYFYTPSVDGLIYSRNYNCYSMKANKSITLRFIIFRLRF